MPSSTPSAPVRAEFVPKVADQPLTGDLIKDVTSAEVDLSVDVPDMATMYINDSSIKDLPHLKTIVDWIGKELEINFVPFNQQQVAGRPSPEYVFKGEIVAVEPQFEESGVVTIVVRAYDKRHRLNRETKTEAYKQMKASDIIQQLVSGSGLTADVQSTTTTYEHLIQRNQTNLEFINYLARLNGFEVRVEGTKLVVKPPANTQTVQLNWGKDLRTFHPRLSLAGQVNEVTVRAWDLKENQAIVGQATTSTSQPAIGYGKWGGAAAQSAFSAAKFYELQRPMVDQSEANKVAEAILNSINTDFIEAEGISSGNPGIKPGVAVDIAKVGPKFSGKYIITSATHIFTKDADYITHFRIEGAQRKMMADLLSNGKDHEDSITSLVVGVVTNIEDPNGTGRVKVKYPWLRDDMETDWARVVSIGAGPKTGIFWLPEVNDTVLVGFEHGNVNRPFVLGGIWHNKAEIPDKGKEVENGKVKTRILQTPGGHKIVFTDSDSGSKLEIIDKGEVTKITLDSQNKAVGIESQGKGTFKTSQAMEMKSDATVTIESGGSLTIKGNAITVEASGTLTLKGATVNIN